MVFYAGRKLLLYSTYDRLSAKYHWSNHGIDNGAQITKFMGQNGTHLGPVGPRWAPCWSHKPCYQGQSCFDEHWIYPLHISEVYFISSWIRKRNIWPIWPRLCKMTLFWRGLRKRWPPCRTLPSTVMYTKYELIENSWTANDILMKLSSMLHPLQVHD